MIFNKIFNSRSKSKTILFLDIDGVLAPMGGSSNENVLEQLSFSGWNPSINYNPSIIESLKTIIQAENIEVQWLTSWQEEANQIFSQIDFGPFKTNFQKVDSDMWWKALVVENSLKKYPQRKICWLDDEISMHFKKDFGTVNWDLTHYKNLLTIAPEPFSGLTNEHVEILKSFLHT